MYKSASTAPPHFDDKKIIPNCIGFGNQAPVVATNTHFRLMLKNDSGSNELFQARNHGVMQVEPNTSDTF
jgi:hypothetical protein